jgi:drug/metabolite transporter (DMT)-like permease
MGCSFKLVNLEGTFFEEKNVWNSFRNHRSLFFVTTNLDPLTLTQGMILGDGLVFLAGIIWSFFMVYNKKLVDAYNVIQFMPWLFLATTLPLIPFIPFSTNISLMNFSIEAWMIIIYTAAFCWVVPYYLWIRGLKHISPAIQQSSC